MVLASGLVLEPVLESVSVPEQEAVLASVVELGGEPVLAVEWAAVSVSAQELEPVLGLVLESGEEPVLELEPVLAPGWGR